MNAEAMLAVMATLWLQASVLLAGAALIDAGLRRRGRALGEGCWALALYGAFVLTAIQWALPDPGWRRWSDVVATAGAVDATPVAQVARPQAKQQGAPEVSRSAHTVEESGDSAAAARRFDLRALAAQAALAAWLALIALALLRVGTRLRRGVHALRALPRLRDRRWRDAAARIARVLGAPPPRLRRGAHGEGPCVAGRELCVPDWAMGLEPGARDAMLAHEITHLARRDLARAALSAIAHWALLFHPLAGLARRRLAEAAERACDARAAVLVADPRSVARALLACGEHLEEPVPALAGLPAMRSDRHALLRRVQALLENHPVTARTLMFRALVATGLLAAAAAVPLFGDGPLSPLRTAFAGEGGVFSVSHIDTGSGETLRIREHSAERTLKLDAHGDFAFDAAERDLASLDEGAELSIEETRGGVTRRVEFENVDGRIVRRFERDGDQAPWDAQAAEWFAQIVPHLLREAGLDAKRRSARILAQSGPEGLLAEIDRIRRDHVRRRYLTTLAGTPLSNPQFDRAIAATAAMDSDYEQRLALVALAKGQRIDSARFDALARVTAAMDSDYEQRLVLTALAPHLVEDADPAVFARALSAVDSDYERRLVLVDAAASAPAAWHPALLGAIEDMDSDYERRLALEALAPRVKGPAATEAYARTAAALASDYEQRLALIARIEASEVDAAGARALLEAIDELGSDYEARLALVALAGKMPSDAALIRRYREVARTLGDYERGQSEQALDRFTQL